MSKMVQVSREQTPSPRQDALAGRPSASYSGQTRYLFASPPICSPAASAGPVQSQVDGLATAFRPGNGASASALSQWPASMVSP